jgi:hypothetical protein
MPITLNSEGVFFVVGKFATNVSFPVYLPMVPRILEISVDDCLLNLNINGRSVQNGLPYCNYRYPFYVNLSEVFGENQFEIKKNFLIQANFSNTGGRGRIKISVNPLDQSQVLLRMIVLIFGSLTVYFIAWIFKFNSSNES